MNWGGIQLICPVLHFVERALRVEQRHALTGTGVYLKAQSHTPELKKCASRYLILNSSTVFANPVGSKTDVFSGQIL